MKKYELLVVDDEWNMRNLIKIYLSKNGLDVEEASNGNQALTMVHEKSYDLVILDIMMPDLDGWIVCGKIRETSNVPVLMLTARTDTKDKVKGLNMGADDYLVKPFDPEELIARVFALLRRTTRSAIDKPPMKIEHEQMEIYPEGREVFICNQQVEFTQIEFSLLCLLAQNPKRAYTRDLLLEQIWGQDYFGDARTVDTHIKNIREKADIAGLGYNPIQTVWGVGYKFNERRRSL